MQFHAIFQKKLRGLHIDNMQLLIKSIQYRTYKFMYRIFVYLSYMFRIIFIDYCICIVIYDIRYTI